MRRLIFSSANPFAAVLLASLLATAGCGLVAAVIRLPLQILSGVFSFGFGFRIGADGESSIEDELRAGGIRIDKHALEVDLHDDLTLEGTLEVETTVTSAAGLARAQRAELQYEPASQRVEVIHAEVRNADGTVVHVDPSMVLERPSAAAENAPGFVSARTVTALFPQLRVGSRTYVKWRFEEKNPPALGFNFAWRPQFALPVTEASFRIRHPASVELRSGQRGGFEVDDHASGGGMELEAVLRGYAGQQPERAMVAPRDVCPLLVVSTLKSWEEIGAKFDAAIAGAIEDTPRIREVAEQAAGGASGVEAARAIHRYVATRIQYLAVHVDEASVWMPHPASAVLDAGFGDCKDQVAVLLSLLRARGIAAEAVLIDRQLAFEPSPLPTPLQFDHCIAWLPELELYSDPSDPTRDLGELPVALSDKLAVAATPEGKVLHTPAGRPEQNRYSVRQVAKLRADGVVAGTTEMDLTGRAASRMRMRLARAADAASAADALLVDAPESGTGSLESSDPSNLSIPLHCTGNWTADVPIAISDEFVASVPAGIDLLTPSRVNSLLSRDDRRFPIVLSALEADWTIELALPPGVRARRLPPDREVENAAGSFHSKYLSTETGLIATRRLVIAKDRYAPAENAALQQVLRAFADDSRAAFVAAR